MAHDTLPTDPTRIDLDGRPFWRFPTGELLPVVSGAQDDPPAGDPPAGDPPAGDPAGDPPAGDPPANDDDDVDDGELPDPVKAVLTKERKAAKEAKAAAAADRRRAEAAEAELEKVRQANLTESEKALEEAEARGRSAALSDVGERLAAAELRVALTGVVPDPASIIDELNLAKYVTDTGDVDLEAVKALAGKWAGITKPGTPGGSADQGPQGGNGKKPAASLADAVNKHYASS